MKAVGTVIIRGRIPGQPESTSQITFSSGGGELAALTGVKEISCKLLYTGNQEREVIGLHLFPGDAPAHYTDGIMDATHGVKRRMKNSGKSR